jgi:CCR4-NOT transcription complex subunit 1
LGIFKLFFLVLQIDLLAEISIAPRIMSDVDGALKSKQLKTEVDEYLKVK